MGIVEHKQDILITVEKAARRLRLDPMWLESEALAGRVPCLLAGSKILLNLDAVTEVLTARASHSLSATTQERPHP